MAIETTAPRSRRALLTAGIGALGALAATAIGRPDPVAADTDTSAVHKGVNNPTSAETRITSSGGIALKGVVNTGTANLAGVAGVSNSPHASGVFGQGVFGVSGFGTGTTGAGVIGSSSKPAGFGVEGINQSTTGNAVGVQGISKSPSGTGVIGRAISGNGGTGVQGISNGIGVEGSGTNVGVRALSDAVGFEAQVSNADGVGFQADVSLLGASAVAAEFTGGGANDAIALRARGPVAFPTASGIATIQSGHFNVVVNTRVPANARILAVLNDLPGIPNNAVVQCAVRLNASQFQIQLTHAPDNNVSVAWFVIG
jgi:hypothetical protein